MNFRVLLPAVAGLIFIILFYVLRDAIFLLIAVVIFIAGSVSISALSRSRASKETKS